MNLGRRNKLQVIIRETGFGNVDTFMAFISSLDMPEAKALSAKLKQYEKEEDIIEPGMSFEKFNRRMEYGHMFGIEYMLPFCRYIDGTNVDTLKEAQRHAYDLYTRDYELFIK